MRVDMWEWQKKEQEDFDFIERIEELNEELDNSIVEAHELEATIDANINSIILRG